MRKVSAQRIEDQTEYRWLPGDSSEDKRLTLAFQRGQKGAYDAIYRRYARRVDAICRRMLCNSEDSREAAQETFLRVYLSLPKFNGSYRLGSWIARIATNICLDHLRAKERRPSEVAPLELVDGDHFYPEEEPEAIYMRGSERRRVREVLASLPPMHRAAIILRDFEGFSYGEIASTLDISENQVKALLHRARGRFKRSWSSLGAALLPLRFLQRFRSSHSTAAEHTSQLTSQLSASGAQVASMCSAIVGQCGVVLTERLGALAATTLIGTAAAASSFNPAPPAPLAVEVDQHTTRDAAALSETSSIARERTRPEVSRDSTPSEGSEPAPPSESPKKDSEATGGETPAASPSPTPSPSPSPAVSPSPSPAVSPSPSPAPSPSKSSSPEQAPVVAAVGFGAPGSVAASTAVASDLTVDCATTAFRQRLEIPVHNGEAVYDGRLDLNYEASLGVELTIWTQGMEIRYSGGGTVTERERNGDILHMAFQGIYATGNPYTSMLGLPDSGNFQVDLTLDCATHYVVFESVAFAAQ